MTRSPRTTAATLSLAAALLACAGCHFDDSRLEALRCDDDAACADGRTCCQGYCVGAASCPPETLDLGAGEAALPDIDLVGDPDGDRVKNPTDNCPTVANPDQADGDKDGRGDACDCAPADPNFATTALKVTAFSAGGALPLSPVESAADWQVVGAALKQINKDGMRRALHGATAAAGDLRVSATFRLGSAGADGITSPADPLALAGVMVRAAASGAGQGGGYYCGLDHAGDRLLLAKTSGSELSSGRLSLLPGAVAAGTGLVEGTVYTVTLRVRGKSLQCQARLPNDRTLSQSGSDGDHATGAAALFTLGSAAQFDAVTVCTP